MHLLTVRGVLEYHFWHKIGFYGPNMAHPDLVTPRFSDIKTFPPRMSLNRGPTVVLNISNSIDSIYVYLQCETSVKRAGLT